MLQQYIGLKLGQPPLGQQPFSVSAYIFGADQQLALGKGKKEALVTGVSLLSPSPRPLALSKPTKNPTVNACELGKRLKRMQKCFNQIT